MHRNFQTQTAGLVHDIFILNTRNLAAQEHFVRNQRTPPNYAIECALALVEGALRQKLYGETKIETETPFFRLNKNKDCIRCGMEIFTMDHLKVSIAKSKQCNVRGMTGHFEKVNKPTTKQTQPKQPPRQVNCVDAKHQSEYEEDEEEQVVL